jgi:hypothetical protein
VDVDRSPAPLAALLPSYRPIFDRLLLADLVTNLLDLLRLQHLDDPGTGCPVDQACLVKIPLPYETATPA